MNFSKNIKIGKFIISPKSKTFVIAEAGVNHNGSFKQAMKLIDCAVVAKADAVKFQAFKTDQLILREIKKAPYQKKTTDKKESQFEMLKKLELSFDQLKSLKQYARKRNIIFLVTPFDEISLAELEECSLSAHKISSTDITNLPFLIKVAKTGRPVILSTGMSMLCEVERALKAVYTYNRKIILLHCTSSYPAKTDEVNLRVLNSLREKFNILVGFSDHTAGFGAAPYAVALGASIIEKHFTLDRSLPGPDHKASLSPLQLREFVRTIRCVEGFLGDHLKKITVSEVQARKALQKCFVARKNILKGEKFNDNNLIAKRTGGKGISPIDFRLVYGQRSKRDFKANEVIRL